MTRPGRGRLGGRNVPHQARRRCAGRLPSGTSAPSCRAIALRFGAGFEPVRPASACRHCRAGWRRSSRAGRRRRIAPASGRSIFKASPWWTCRRPARLRAMPRRPSAKRSSSSTAISFATPLSSRARVRPPGPGPTSMTVLPSTLPPAVATRFSRAGSNRKCWPRDFFAAPGRQGFSGACSLRVWRDRSPCGRQA